MGRIARSFRLVGQSYQILLQDSELMVLPLISGVVMIAVSASFFFGFGIDYDGIEEGRADTLVPVFLLYVATYAIGIFFQAAVIAGATERLRGGNPTVGSALAVAGRRLWVILLWAVLAATVGVLLRVIHERVGFVGRIITSLIGAAWSLATFFVVPVLVLEDHSLGESFTRSLTMFKRTWGETVVGGASVGVAAFAAWMTLVAIVGLLVWAGVGFAALLVGAVGAVLLMIFFSALQGVYVASLYRFATDGQSPAGFDADLMASAFVTKSRQA